MTRVIQMDAPARREALRGGDGLAVLERMVEIRTLEDRVVRLFFDGHVDGTTHTAQGQEAVAVGLAAVLRPTDTVACTYRGHAHALALGVNPRRVLAEIMGRVGGTMNGLGGSMHLSDPDVGLLPTFAIVGAGIPVAAGAALTAQVKGTDDVGVAVFGDGATNIGAFHEGLNLASVWKLPAVFIIENNLYGEYSPLHRTTPIEDLHLRGASYAMPSRAVDGQDVDEVRAAVAGAVALAREGGGPTLLEMKTYRYSGHSRSDPATYRPDGELDEWRRRDPLDVLAGRLRERGVLSEGRFEEMLDEAQTHIEDLVEELLEAPQPTREDMLTNIWAG